MLGPWIKANSIQFSSVAQSCPTLWDPMDCSPPGSSIHEIFQARILEWVAISFSRGSFQSRDWTGVSCIAGKCFYHLSHQGSPIYCYRQWFIYMWFYCAVKNLPAVQETQIQFLGWEDPLEKEMATHSSILAWKISWTEEPDGVQSMGSQRVRHDWV